MAEIFPAAAKNIDPNQFELFKSDLALLLKVITQDELGKRMGINKSNVNKYVRGNLPITRSFLEKFYAVWGNRINEENSHVIQESPIYSPPENKAYPSLRDIMTILQRIEQKLDRQAGQPDDKN
jgi:transcriptional regulator with XRE-family HTH domain